MHTLIANDTATLTLNDRQHPEGAAQRAQWIQATPRFHGHPELIAGRFVTGCTG